MKTTHLMLGGFLLAGIPATAQQTENDTTAKGKISITIVKEVDGRKTVIDTSFDLANESAYKKFMMENAVNFDDLTGPGKDVRMRTFRTDENQTGQEEEIVIRKPSLREFTFDMPIPPGPPKRSDGNFEDVQVYSYRYSDDQLMDKMEDIEMIIDSHPEVRQKVRKEIRRIEWKDEPSGKRKKNKKGKHRIIIIEEA